MENVSDPVDRLARKLFLWTVVYAIAFGFGVLLILRHG